jgi:hypothetical protein
LLVVQQFLSALNHHILRISLRVTFSSSLLWKCASKWHVSQPWRISNWMWRPKSGRFQKTPSAGASTDLNLKAIRYALSYVLPLKSKNTISRNFLIAHCIIFRNIK